MKFFKIKNWLNWRLFGPYVCTLAVAVSLNNTWRVPREAFRYGGLTSALLTTWSSACIAMPVVLLQLSIGQLSQQDAVGVWRAVPFFKGIGYLRLLISSISAIYSMVYIALSFTYIMYILNNTFPFWKCDGLAEAEVNADIYNTASCLNDVILAPITETSEYYTALAFIVIVFWILFPFILYKPIKCMKRILYALAPLVPLLGVSIVSYVGSMRGVSFFSKKSDWSKFVQPHIWHGAIVQALLSCQTAGGFLISSGDSIYANTNVQWTTVIIVGANIIATWLGILFWFAISGKDKNANSNIAVLVQVFEAAAQNKFGKLMPLLTLVLLTLSGAISMFTCLYPLYDRFRRVGGYKWRHVSMGSSIVGAAGAITILAMGHPALTLLEDVVVPFLLCVTTVLEVSAFIFIYGWKTLAEDIEFLTETKLPKLWGVSWYAIPGIIIAFTAWWSTSYFLDEFKWIEAPWASSGMVASAFAIIVIIMLFAASSVAKQVQYDFVGKLKSSFKPSRHWGPRDPITHHYWLSRREEAYQNGAEMSYRRRELGQFSGWSSFAEISSGTIVKSLTEVKKRSNSDDCLVTFRKQHIADLCQIREYRSRSKSVDLCCIRSVQLQSSNSFNEENQINKGILNNSLHSTNKTYNNTLSDNKKDLV